MGIDDKISNEADRLIGEGKEAVGRATDDEELEKEGRSDQLHASARKVGEHLKDAVDDVSGAARKIVGKD